MISPGEIKIKAEKKYTFFLQSIIQEIPFSKIIIRCDKSYSKSLPDYNKEIMALMDQSKDKKGFGYSIDYEIVKTKHIGTQSLPVCIYFDSEKDFLKYLGKEKEVEFFRQNCMKILSIFPNLKDWVIQNPSKIVQNQEEWDNIIKVCVYFENNPRPNLYLRELPVNVHTKFIEKNQTIIRDLLDIIIITHINIKEKSFEPRFNLKYSEPLVRFKILDKEISNSFFSGIDDIAISQSEFVKLNLPVTKVLIVENKISLYTTLTLPRMKNAIAIFGGGYNVQSLKTATWLNKTNLLYWGDIDVQGFEILSQFRGYFPNTKSVLMDMTTFDKFFEKDRGTPSKITTQLNLTEKEEQLYLLLKTNNWRLEQEKIPIDFVKNIFLLE